MLLGLCFLQLHIYRTTGYERSKSIVYFCLFCSIPAFLEFFVQARILPNSFIYWLTMIAFTTNGALRSYYLKSLSYFVAIPNGVLKFCYAALLVLSICSALPLCLQIMGYPYLLFDSRKLFAVGNFFADSFTRTIGRPSQFTVIMLSLYATIDLIYSVIILRLVYRSTRDPWFIAGLCLTLFICLEHFSLPFTTKYYIPLFFLSFTFEALRMSFLSLKEYIVERELLSGNLKKTEPLKEIDKYQNSNLTDERIEFLGAKLIDYLEKTEIYKNPNLRLDKLAFAIGIPSYQLSQVINYGLHTSFYEMINTYRINSIIEHFMDPSNDDKNILDIAYENGFNSKSTFNVTFKKMTGTKPSEYRNQFTASGEANR